MEKQKHLTTDFIENLRKVTGTLPSERPVKNTEIRRFNESIDITIEDHSHNPYKAMFVAATSTWGDNKFESKWAKTDIEGKLEVIKAVLTHNTLPQAKEMVNFVFRVNGVPRWLFDYHTQVPFISIMSIGCRDNSKLDSDIVITPQTVDDITSSHVDKLISLDTVFKDLKNLYEEVLNADQSSWQSARTFLPQSYLHAYHFSQNLLAIVGVKGFHASKFFGNTEEEIMLRELYCTICFAIHKKFPLIGFYAMICLNSENDKNKRFEEIRNLTVSQLSVEDLKYFNQI